MNIKKTFCQINEIHKDLVVKTMSAIIIITVVCFSFFSTNIPRFYLNPSNTNERSENDLLNTPLNPVMQNEVDSKLKKFFGGFLVQTSTKNQNIQYVIQNPSLSVGFGISSLKIILKETSGNSDLVFREVSQTFPNSNIIIPFAKNPITTNSIYYIGSNTGEIRTEYEKIVFKNLYNNIDLEYSIENGDLKYNFYVFPGGDPNDIQIQWNGIANLEKTIDGMKISVNTNTGQKHLIDKEPIAYQEGASKNPEITFKLFSQNSYGFKVTNYQANYVLLIDPAIYLLSTYVGGSNDEYGYGIDIDSQHNIYVTGYTQSIDFPTVNAVNSTKGLNYDVFVFKLSSSDSSLLFSTFIGGNNDDRAYDIAIDKYDNIYITGYTYSPDFPTKNAFNKTKGLGYDVFLVKLSSTGSLLSSTYIGGSNSDYGFSIEVDLNNNIYIGGYTSSNNFPVINAYKTYNTGTTDVFILKLSPNGTTLLYSTYIGGSGGDYLTAIDILNGEVYAIGITQSTNFPTVNAFKSSYSGGTYDTFVCKLSNNGSSLVYSTYVGGSAYDVATGIAVDETGNAIVTGQTNSANFPTVNAINSTKSLGYDLFIYKLSNTGLSMVFSTFLGGSLDEFGSGIDIDSSGNIYVIGYTYSSNFPIVDSYYYKPSVGFDYNTVVLKLSVDGLSLLYSTIIGGIGQDIGICITIDDSGNAYVAGYTASTDFPTLNAYDRSYGGGPYDVFVLKISTVTGLALTPLQGMVVSSGSSHYLELAWNAPAYQNSFLNYNIYRKSSMENYSLIGTSIDSHFIDESVVAGLTYYYTISPIYSFGVGINSTEFSGILPIIPTAPPSLTVLAGNRSAMLNWTFPLFDGGSPILEFQIYRGINSGEYSLIGVTANLFFNDMNLNGGSKYFYVVAAVNAIGIGDYSMENSVTPFGPASLDYTTTSIITTTITQPGATITNTKTETVSNSNSILAKSTSGFDSMTFILLLTILSPIFVYRRKRKFN